MHTGLIVLLYVALAALIIWRVISRGIRGATLSLRNLAIPPLVLAAIGGYLGARALPSAPDIEIALFGLDLTCLAGLGALRSFTLTISSRGGYAYQKGDWRTVTLWLVTAAVRIGFVALAAALHTRGDLTSMSIVLSLGVTIGVQNAVTYRRARQLGLRIATHRAQAATYG